MKPHIDDLDSEPSQRTDTGVVTSVILCFRNGREYLPAQLDALANQATTVPWELVLVDNGSRDGAGEVAAEHLDRFERALLVHDNTPGLAHARNVGVRSSHGDVLLFCDADDVVSTAWVELMTQAAESFDVFGGPLDEVSLNPEEIRGWRTPLPTDDLPDSPGFRYVVGANHGCRRAAWRTLGGYDEQFAVSSDDCDLTLRAHLAGLRVGFAPGAFVAYRYRETPRENFRQFANYFENLVLLRRKHRARGVELDYSAVLPKPRDLKRLMRTTRAAVEDLRVRGQWAVLAGSIIGTLRGLVLRWPEKLERD